MTTQAVALKLPEFWQEHAAVWFAQAEAQFAIRGITQDDTMYYYIVAALDSSTASRALSLLQDPPHRDKYLSLKQLLLETYELSEPERARKLLSLPGLGDSKPSELMDHMLTLLGDHQPCFLFKELFLQQMPGNVRTALASSPLKDPRALAREADKVFNANRQPSPAVVFPTVAPSYEANAIAAAQHQPTSGLCYFHARFGPRAKKCRLPCSFVPGNGKAGAH